MLSGEYLSALFFILFLPVCAVPESAPAPTITEQLFLLPRRLEDRPATALTAHGSRNIRMSADTGFDRVDADPSSPGDLSRRLSLHPQRVDRIYLL